MLSVREEALLTCVASEWVLNAAKIQFLYTEKRKSHYTFAESITHYVLYETTYMYMRLPAIAPL